jgi:hypothetical protein
MQSRVSGTVFCCDGRVDETAAAGARAFELEPLSPVQFLQSASLVIGSEGHLTQF